MKNEFEDYHSRAKKVTRNTTTQYIESAMFCMGIEHAHNIVADFAVAFYQKIAGRYDELLDAKIRQIAYEQSARYHFNTAIYDNIIGSIHSYFNLEEAAEYIDRRDTTGKMIAGIVPGFAQQLFETEHFLCELEDSIMLSFLNEDAESYLYRLIDMAHSAGLTFKATQKNITDFVNELIEEEEPEEQNEPAPRHARPPKFQHPDDALLKWTGIGKRPKWYIDLIEAGREPVVL